MRLVVDTTMYPVISAHILAALQRAIAAIGEASTVELLTTAAQSVVTDPDTPEAQDKLAATPVQPPVASPAGPQLAAAKATPEAECIINHVAPPGMSVECLGDAFVVRRNHAQIACLAYYGPDSIPSIVGSMWRMYDMAAVAYEAEARNRYSKAEKVADERQEKVRSLESQLTQANLALDQTQSHQEWFRWAQQLVQKYRPDVQAPVLADAVKAEIDRLLHANSIAKWAAEKLQKTEADLDKHVERLSMTVNGCLRVVLFLDDARDAMTEQVLESQAAAKRMIAVANRWTAWARQLLRDTGAPEVANLKSVDDLRDAIECHVTVQTKCASDMLSALKVFGWDGLGSAVEWVERRKTNNREEIGVHFDGLYYTDNGVALRFDGMPDIAITDQDAARLEHLLQSRGKSDKPAALTEKDIAAAVEQLKPDANGFIEMPLMGMGGQKTRQVVKFYPVADGDKAAKKAGVKVAPLIVDEPVDLASPRDADDTGRIVKVALGCNSLDGGDVWHAVGDWLSFQSADWASITWRAKGGKTKSISVQDMELSRDVPVLRIPNFLALPKGLRRHICSGADGLWFRVRGGSASGANNYPGPAKSVTLDLVTGAATLRLA